MFGIGTTELIVILVVALLVLGPKKLPEIAKSLGKAMGEFRRMSTDVKRTIEMEADRTEESEKKKKAAEELFPDKSKEGATASADASATSATQQQTKGREENKT
jgi:sec-independent protein translocase protein TatB